MVDPTLDQIEAHLDRTRQQLGSNLRELEGKVAAATDVRAQFHARPYLMLGAACAGGLLLAALLRPRHGPHSAPPPAAARRGLDARGQLTELWDDIATAMFGVVSATVKDYIGVRVPGFNEHVSRAAQRSPSR
jgi:hypothetical protein